MNSLKDETIRKIFGANVQGGMGLALTLLERASMVNWEALWPQLQKAMIGLGVAAIATIQSGAIRKGLSDLAERIASFQPTVSPMLGEPLTRAEAMPIPYVPMPSVSEMMEAERFAQMYPWIKQSLGQDMGEAAENELIEALRKSAMVFPGDSPQKHKDNCERLKRARQSLEEAMEIFKYTPHLQHGFINVEGLFRAVRILWEDLGCSRFISPQDITKRFLD